MKRSIHQTKDGSPTIRIEELDITYHSRHGALGESMHVFIEQGLRQQEMNKPVLHVLEMGFGTGLNALLTYLENEGKERRIVYDTLEPFPLQESELENLNYPALLAQPALDSVFQQLHNAPWNHPFEMDNGFTLTKYETKLENFTGGKLYDLVYYDAFAPSAQPDLWEEPIFTHLYNMMQKGGALVTYCSKSIVRRAMMAAGFTVTKPPGPWGKREMVRAYKK